MSAKQRKLTLQQLGHLYRRPDNTSFEQCWYCGDTRECLDHVPPLGLLPHISIDKFRQDGGKFVLIPSCNSCNQLLGNKKLFTPNERIAWLLEAYNKLFDKCYNGWTDEEVAEMGYSFRVMINNSRKKANEYHRKIRSIQRRILDIAELEEKGE